MKAGVIETIRAEGHEVTDVGSFNPDPVDFPDVARALCDKILKGEAERGLLVCGTGVGAVIAANKVPGIRAAQCHDTYSAGKAATSNNAQIITMGARVIGAELAKDIADAFLSASFDPEGRSAGNVNAINEVDWVQHIPL